MNCVKVRYPNEEWANKALIKILRSKDFLGEKAARRQECRIYECDYCQGWHLTSKPRWVEHPSYGQEVPSESQQAC